MCKCQHLTCRFHFIEFTDKLNISIKNGLRKGGDPQRKQRHQERGR